MKILLIRPKSFGFNPETAETNKFQNTDLLIDGDVTREKAREEFDAFVSELAQNQIEIMVYDDLEGSDLPDSVFPNNWFATLRGKKLITFPMEAEKRRLERRDDIIDDFEKQGYSVNRELESYEKKGLFLEGTGSVILDHKNKLAYAALSSRTNERVLAHFCAISGYEALAFNATGPAGEPIYHTNVMLSIGDRIAVICPSIIDASQRELILDSLSIGREVLKISSEQAYSHFLGNCLFVTNKKGRECLIMSGRAMQSLTKQQLKVLEKLNIQLVSSPIPTIEAVGGGSARCMMAEVYS